MRRWHILKRNETSETPQQAIWFDTETDQVRISPTEVRHVLRFGWACYRKRNRHGNWSQPEWYHYHQPSEFWTWATSHVRDRTKLWLLCHNTSFDLPVLDSFRELPARGYRLASGIIDSPPTILKYTVEGKSLTILDTLNFWRMPLANLGRHVGLPKLEMPAPNASQEDWDTYARRDVEIIMRACTEWWDLLKREDLGGFAPTLAGQAMRVYRHKYMSHPILIDGHAGALGVARDSYHGARCECNRIGGPFQDVTYVDVNSMYPHVMRTFEMPYRLIGYREKLTARDLRSYLDRGACCAEVDLETAAPFAAIKHRGKLVFPTGRFLACLSSPELEYALSYATVHRVLRLACYERAVLFRDFVMDFYLRRRKAIDNGNPTEGWFYKTLLNSFYGKWGQNGVKWEICGDAPIGVFSSEPFYDADRGELTRIRQFGGVAQILRHEGESLESHPAIAAHITAYARMILWAFMRQATVKEYLYCDTDGIYVTRDGLNRLRDHLDSEALGKLKIVETYRQVFIYGCKDLVCDGKKTLKGIRNIAEQIRPDTYLQEKWTSLKGLLREGRMDTPSTYKILKRLRREYDKGVVNNDGFVAPLHFG